MKNNKSSLKSFSKFVGSNKKGVIILLISLIIMSIANTFFLPYIITSLINGTNMTGYEFYAGVILTLVAICGIVWALFSLSYKGKSSKKTALFIAYLIIFAVVATVLSVAFAYAIGLVGTAWYYIFKNIIAAKFAIDLTSRILNIPFMTFLFCVLGNILAGKMPWSIKGKTFFKAMVIVALCVVVQYLTILPGITAIWFLIISCIVDSILYAVMTIVSASLCRMEVIDNEK